MTFEVWKPIQGYEDLYEVSNYGRVRSLGCFTKGRNNSLRFIKGRILSQIRHGRYLHTLLGRNEDKKWFEVHQLVAQAFISNPNGCDVVHHKDHNPQNNRVENLMWVSKEEHVEIHTNERAKRVDQIDKVTGEILHQWNSATEAARELGYDQGNISKCCNNKYPLNKTYKNYIWRYCLL